MAQLPEAKRIEYVNRMFGRISGRYDWGNRVLSFGRDQTWRRQAVALLNPQPTDLVLDIGAGTADLSICLARRAGRVIALDFSQPMMKVGLEKVRKAGLGHKIAFVTGDALRLPFPDATFDGAATAFTVRNLAGIGAGFSEIHRVLKPHGRFVCLEFTRPPSAVVNFFYRPYLKYLLPFIGGRVTGDSNAYRYLADSITAFPSVQDLGGVMRSAGFQPVRWRFMNLGTVALHIADRASAARERVLP